MHELRAPHASWLVRADAAQALIVHLGMDSEGTGRERTNLLSAPLIVEVDGKTVRGSMVTSDEDGAIHYQAAHGDGVMLWTLRRIGATMSWTLEWRGSRPLSGVAFVAALAPALTSFTVLPHDVDASARMVPPWLVVAPDYGHLLVRADNPDTLAGGVERHPQRQPQEFPGIVPTARGKPESGREDDPDV